MLHQTYLFAAKTPRDVWFNTTAPVDGAAYIVLRHLEVPRLVQRVCIAEYDDGTVETEFTTAVQSRRQQDATTQEQSGMGG